MLGNLEAETLAVSLRLSCSSLLVSISSFLIVRLAAIEKVLQASTFDQTCNALVTVLIERIKVEAKRASEESRVLRDHRDLLTEGLHVDFADVLTINHYATLVELHDSSKGHKQRGLAGPCATHNPDFLACLSLE